MSEKKLTIWTPNLETGNTYKIIWFTSKLRRLENTRNMQLVVLLCRLQNTY